MIIIHRGFGLAITAGAGILSALLVNAFTRAAFDRRYYSEHIWPKFAVFWLAGLICIAAAVFLRRYLPQDADMKWFEKESHHHVFFVPLFIWGIVYFVVGAIYLAYSFQRL
jgi:uncharacterized membrane protein